MSAGASDIVAAARVYLGVPWQHQGRSAAGLDCAGLIVRVAQDLGLSRFDVTGYSPEPEGKLLRRHLQGFQAVSLLDAELGCILLLRFVRFPQHLAIRTDAGIIHTYRQAGKVVEHRYDGVWRARLVAAYAFPGMVN